MVNPLESQDNFQGEGKGVHLSDPLPVVYATVRNLVK